MLSGLQAVIPDGATLQMPGGATGKSTLVGDLTSGLSLYTTVDTQTTALQSARQELQGELPSLRTLLDQMKAALIALFGKTSPQLKQFGLVIKQRTPLTPTQLVERSEKMRQTRSLRGTMGSKQKAEVQFTGQVVVATQVSAPVSAQGSGQQTPVASAQVQQAAAAPGGSAAPASVGTSVGTPGGSTSGSSDPSSGPPVGK